MALYTSIRFGESMFDTCAPYLLLQMSEKFKISPQRKIDISGSYTRVSRVYDLSNEWYVEIVTARALTHAII